MELSDPRAYYIDIITFQTYKKIIRMNPMSLSVYWHDFLAIISLKPVEKIPGMNPMGLSSKPWAKSLDLIAFQ